MTEDALEMRRGPKPGSSVKLSDLTMLVRVPDQPAAVRALTEAERAAAEAYANDHKGTIEDLPT